MREILLFLSLIIPIGLADSDHIAFPEWTYWVEIFEHSGILIVSLVAVAFLFSKYENKGWVKFAIAGFGIFAFSEILTILHHFLIYPFGVWNAIANHGLSLIGLAVIFYSLTMLREKPLKNIRT